MPSSATRAPLPNKPASKRRIIIGYVYKLFLQTQSRIAVLEKHDETTGQRLGRLIDRANSLEVRIDEISRSMTEHAASEFTQAIEGSVMEKEGSDEISCDDTLTEYHSIDEDSDHAEDDQIDDVSYGMTNHVGHSNSHHTPPHSPANTARSTPTASVVSTSVGAEPTTRNTSSTATGDGVNSYMCTDHTREKRSILCFTCDTLICTECTYGVHMKHEYLMASEASAVKASELKYRMSNLRTTLSNLKMMQERIRLVENEVEMKAEEIVNQIYSTFGECVRSLQQREQELIREVERVRRAKSRDLELQMHEIEQDIAATDQTFHVTERLLDQGSDQDIITSHSKILSSIDRLEEVRHTTPSTQDIRFIPEDVDVFVKATASLGRIEGHRRTFPAMSGFEPKLPAVIVCGEEERWKLVVGDAAGSCVNRGGDIVTVSVTNTNTGNHYVASVGDREDGTYSITFTPQHSGDIRVRVQINGEKIPGSPFKVTCEVSRDYALIGECLHIIGSKGSEVEELLHPTSTALNKAETKLFISDTENNRIQVRSYPEMNTLTCFGTEGTGPGEFSHPYGLCVARGRLYVADCKNNRIQVLKEDGTHVQTIGHHGTRLGQLIHPYDIKVDDSGRIYVSDSANFRIQVFSEQGKPITSFGTKGTKNGQFCCPLGLHLTPSEVIVTDFKNHNVQIFSKEGHFIRRIESTKDQPINNPAGVAMDRSGNLFLSNRGSNSVQIFDSELRSISKFGKKGTHPGCLKYPTSVIVDSKGSVIVCDSLNHRIQIF